MSPGRQVRAARAVVWFAFLLSVGAIAAGALGASSCGSATVSRGWYSGAILTDLRIDKRYHQVLLVEPADRVEILCIERAPNEIYCRRPSEWVRMAEGR